MKGSSKILFVTLGLLILLSVSATFYKTVILQDFSVEGTYIEFPAENSSYIWFIYDDEEYELELETSNYKEIVSAVANELGIDETKINGDFLESLQNAYEGAEIPSPPDDSTAMTSE